MSRKLSLVLACCVALACGGRQAEPAIAPLPDRPFAGLASQRLILLPIHYLRPADTLGWAASVPAPREMLRELDQRIATELGERGLRSQWLFPEQLAQSARRNPTYVPDPYTLAAERLRPGGRPLPQGMLTDPLASQLRALVAVHEDGRMVLFPVELRFEPVGVAAPPATGAEGAATARPAGRATLRVLLVDARTSAVRWAGDVSGDPAPALGPEVIASLVERFADMVAP